MTEQRSPADEVADQYAKGIITRREAVASLRDLGVQGVPAGKLLAAALAAEGAEQDA
ncbi:MAG: hypothetical protein M3376_05720 [Actinomycetota bacterium]|nr:hypothetical protein [Actinomycetota bacterium]